MGEKKKKKKKAEIRPHSLVRPPATSSYIRLTMLQKCPLKMLRSARAYSEFFPIPMKKKKKKAFWVWGFFFFLSHNKT